MEDTISLVARLEGPVPTVLSAPVPVESAAARVLVRLVAPVVPAVTTSEFCKPSEKLSKRGKDSVLLNQSRTFCI
jgi:hypothetical protein